MGLSAKMRSTRLSRDLEGDLGLSLGARIKYLKTEPLLARGAIQLRLNLRATGFILHHPGGEEWQLIWVRMTNQPA